MLITGNGYPQGPVDLSLASKRLNWTPIGRRNGGGGGNRTRVRQSSTHRPYMLSLSLIWPSNPRQTGWWSAIPLSF